MKRLTQLDWLVMFIISIAFTLPSVSFVIDHNNLVAWLQNNLLAIKIFSIASCLILFIWVARGGCQSPLWCWFPPFCLFPKVTWIKKLVVAIMILGTIMAILSK
jgi:hypothetical protein